MTIRTSFWMVLTLCLAVIFAVSPVMAQSNPTFVPLSGGARALLYRPDNNPSPNVAVLTVHRTGDKFTALECTELSRRGFAVLCLNTRFQNNEALVDFEKIPLDVKQGVDYLKKQGIAKVILLGHSGGGATTTLYQAVAEAGPSFCQGPTKMTQWRQQPRRSTTGGWLDVAGRSPFERFKRAALYQSGGVQRGAAGSGGSCAGSFQSCQRLQPRRPIALPCRVREAIQRGSGKADESMDRARAAHPEIDEGRELDLSGQRCPYHSERK